jgi:hypothetical protein
MSIASSQRIIKQNHGNSLIPEILQNNFPEINILQEISRPDPDQIKI